MEGKSRDDSDNLTWPEVALFIGMALILLACVLGSQLID